MSRQVYTEVSCDYCGNAINHIPRAYGLSINSYLRSEGVIVSKYGDFCDKNCHKLYISNDNKTKGC